MTRERQRRELCNGALDERVYTQAMGGTATSGTPDSYYEGSAGILWVEWKWTDSLNPRVIPEPEELQKFWLKRAHRNGISVAVICGSPTTNYIFSGLTWESRKVSDAALFGWKQVVAQWIEEQVL